MGNPNAHSFAVAACIGLVGLAFAGASGIAQAAEIERASNEVIEEVVAIGTRGKPRSVADSTVPVDVISGADFEALGNSADLTDNLKALVPSYTATPATGDGSAFVRPTSLRGTAPDQTLVLINGKRRHRSALVQFFAPAAGNGAHGVDVGMIPGLAVKRVEVLRDGAASQYGSDAIAGVINFVMKDAPEGGDLVVQVGQHFEDEDSLKLGANFGFALGETGFINITGEYIENDALSRGNQRPDAQALVDAGVAGVGADSPFDDAPFAQTWGRPETEGVRLFVNSGFDVSDSTLVYARVGYADTEGRYRFFYRNPGHSTLASLASDGYAGPVLDTGYTPYLDGKQQDLSAIIGVEGETDNGMLWDVSVSYGRNELEYFLNNTTNPSLGVVNGEIAQRNFDVGGYEQEELNFNADISLPLGDNLNLGFGAEWREETYTAEAGEPNSYFGSGSNGFGGISPNDAGEFDRDNFALYADLEQDVTDDLLLQYALRYEDFSDFGSTVNGKLAANWSLSDRVALRGAVSTGFHAPTPGQANVQTTITTFDGITGLQVEEGLVRPTDPRVAAVGGTELKEEKSFNISAGFVAEIGDNWNITVDFYQIDVEDRIYRTGDIAVPDTTNTISFYTNALDVQHQGVDIVLTTDIDWSNTVSTAATLAYNHNRIEVEDQSLVGGVRPVSASLVEDIENNYPENRWVLTTNTRFNDHSNLMLRANFYGEHWDERGTIGAATSPSAEIDALIMIDLELGYQMNDNIRFVLGGSNVFDQYPDKIGQPNANRVSVGLPYPRRSAANYEGGSWYLRAQYSF